MTIGEMGCLLATWGVTQGGAPSLSVSLVDGSWRAHLHAGHTTLLVVAGTYAEVMTMIAARIRVSMVRTLAAAEVAP